MNLGTGGPSWFQRKSRISFLRCRKASCGTWWPAKLPPSWPIDQDESEGNFQPC